MPLPVVSPLTVMVLLKNEGQLLPLKGDEQLAVIGQAGAGAIIDILYGNVNPSGKLAGTFPLKLSDTPAYLNFPGERNQVRYGEGIYVGYRAYEALEHDVLFPFALA